MATILVAFSTSAGASTAADISQELPGSSFRQDAGLGSLVFEQKGKTRRDAVREDEPSDREACARIEPEEGCSELALRQSRERLLF